MIFLVSRGVCHYKRVRRKKSDGGGLILNRRRRDLSSSWKTDIARMMQHFENKETKLQNFFYFFNLAARFTIEKKRHLYLWRIYIYIYTCHTIALASACVAR